MQETILSLLCCPITRSSLSLVVIQREEKDPSVIAEGILFAHKDWFYPITGGIPRLYARAFKDYGGFLGKHLPDYEQRRRRLEGDWAGFLAQVEKKNSRTEESFSVEWGLYDYEQDKTWGAGREEMLERFLAEVDETAAALAGKLILDAGCGNGLLDSLIAGCGAKVVAFDLSNSIEAAYRQNKEAGVSFIQGDLQYPPLQYASFDIVHSSGVLHHTNNTRLSFCCLESCTKPDGKVSLWLYHPRKNTIHRLFNGVRALMSSFPTALKNGIIRLVFFPVSYIIKRLKGNRQNKREMMVALLDWLSPEFRWEHTPDEVAAWLSASDYGQIKVTTVELFGFNIIGTKRAS